MSIEADIQKYAPGAVVDMYVLDATALGGSITRLCNHSNELGADVVWQGNTYSRFPIEVDGYELTGNKVTPRPVMRVANANQLIGALVRTYNDLVGATLTRKRTFLKYLDAVNFDGGTNPDADPNVEFNDEVYVISRKTQENKVIIEFELVIPIDLEGVKLPRRQIAKNNCSWEYRSTECGYAGGAVADEQDVPTAVLAEDQCGKRLTSCKLRFGENNQLPFGGFPGVGKI